MGLGPGGSSLLERLDRAHPLTLDWLLMDRQERGALRREAAIRYGQKHRKPKKPIAPVRGVKVGKAKMWMWLGETGVLNEEECYTSAQIRAVGFKLPKWEEKKDD